MASYSLKEVGVCSVRLRLVFCRQIRQTFTLVVRNFNVPTFARPHTSFCKRYQLAGPLPFDRLIFFDRDNSIHNHEIPMMCENKAL